MVRCIARPAALAVLLALGLVLASSPAGASITWCRTDPVVKIDGQTAHIYLSSVDTLNLLATGPAQIVVTVPTGVSTALLAVDQGFGGWGYAVSFEQSAALKRTATSIPIVIAVYVPSADSSLPVQVEFRPASSSIRAADADGSVNSWVTLKTR